MKDNSTLIKVISFLFPPIGLIIFAINIGKNDTLAKMSVKYALLGIVIVPLTIFIILTILYGGYNSKINEMTSSIKVPIANVYIGSREQITEDMIDYIEISKTAIKDNLITDTKDIIGKYTNNSCTIPKGAMFYDDCLVNNNIDTDLTSVKDGYTVYSLDFKENYIFPNDTIDLYYINNDNKIYGKILDKIKVLNIENEKMLIEIPNDMYDLLINTTVNKYLKAVPTNANISVDSEYKEMITNDLLNYLQ